MEKVKFGILFVLLVVVIGMMGALHSKDIKNAITPDKSVELQENTVDTTFTTDDWLILQSNYINDACIDSVFRTMPQVVLLHIVTNIGTDLSIEDVVTIYLDNKEVYDNIEWGANTQKELDIPHMKKESSLSNYSSIDNTEIKSSTNKHVAEK